MGEKFTTVDDYIASTSAIQFQHEEPIPADLIKRILEYRITLDKVS